MRKIPLTQGKFALVDAEDFVRINRHKWCACKYHNGYYAKRNIKGTTVYMHREILRLTTKDTVQVDHINGVMLDNTKVNLRQCTCVQNLKNTKSTKGSSKYKGVSWHKCLKRWHARIVSDGKVYSLGCYKIEDCAALAYDFAAVKYHKEFARTNF